MAQPSSDLCDHGRLVFIEEAGHFVQHEEPARVNELLLQYLQDIVDKHLAAGKAHASVVRYGRV
jgi:hypothetical protein